MGIYQAFNKKTGSWVKYEFTKEGIKFFDVKQKDKGSPFKDVPIRGNKR